MFNINFSLIEHRYKKLGDDFYKKGEIVCAYTLRLTTKYQPLQNN